MEKPLQTQLGLFRGLVKSQFSPNSQTFSSVSASFPTAHTWSNRCALFPRGLHFGLVHTNQGHVLETLTAEPEVLQPLATCLRRQNELIDLAIAQVAQFPPTVRIGAVADHHIPCSSFVM